MMVMRRALLLIACWLSAGCAQTTSSQIIIKNGEKVAFLGDSITAGGGNYGGYCRLVVHGLKAKDIWVKPVLAGVPGNTSEHMLNRLDESVLRHKPDWVFLAAGVNDIWHSDPTVKIGVFQPKPGMGVKLEDYEKNVSEIVDRCTKAGARVMLSTITPIREDPMFKLNLISATYNEFLARLARERGLPVARLNEAMFAEIAGGTRLTSDGVHPIAEGHRVMAKGILWAMGLTEQETSAIEKEWKSAPRVLILGDRQTTSGGRTGGWCHMLMDGLNSGREMITYSTYARYRGQVTVKDLLAGFRERAKSKPRYAILQAPRDDALAGTPLAQYRKTVREFVSVARESGIHPVLVTIPVQDNAPASRLSASLEPYNRALRDISSEMKVSLADINRAMTIKYAADNEVRLTHDGERFGHKGAMLMAETLMRAMGLHSLITPELRKTWVERPSYTKKK